MHVTRNSANGDVCQPVKQLPQVNWWKSHHLDVLKPSWTKHCKIYCREQSWNGRKINNGLLSHSAQEKKLCESIQNTLEICQFGLSFQGSIQAVLLCKHQVRFVFGEAERQRKRRKSKYESTACCMYCPDHPFLGHSPSLPLCQSSLLHCKTFPS